MTQTYSYTKSGQRVLDLARIEAERFHHSYIGTEHLLLGLIRGSGAPNRAFARLGVTVAKVRTAVESQIGIGDRALLAEIGLTSRSKKVVVLADDERRKLGQDLIGPEHLALGLVREGEGIAAGIIESLGVNLERLRNVVLLELQSPTRRPRRRTQ